MNLLHVWSRSFSNLVLHWVLRWMSLHVSPLRANFSVPTSFCWFSKPKVLGTHLSSAGCKRWGTWCGARTPSSSGRSSIFVRSVVLVGCCARGEVFGETALLTLLPILMWSFYPLLWRWCLASVQVFFRSICSCRFGVSMGGGEFRIFLCWHLNPTPTM